MVLSDVAQLHLRISILETEIKRWKLAAFVPVGAYHHNAIYCPYCNPHGLIFDVPPPPIRCSEA